MDSERRNLGRGPNQRPETLGERDADPVPPRKAVRHHEQLDVDVVEFIGRESARVFMRATVREIEQSVADQPGLSLRRDLGHADREFRHRYVRCDPDLCQRIAENLDVGIERR